MSAFTLEIPNYNLKTHHLIADESDERDKTVIAVAEAVGIVEVEEYPSAGGWRWRLENPGNHKNLCNPGEVFHDRHECRENFRRIYRLMGAQKAILWKEVEG